MTHNAPECCSINLHPSLEWNSSGNPPTKMMPPPYVPDYNLRLSLSVRSLYLPRRQAGRLAGWLAGRQTSREPHFSSHFARINRSRSDLRADGRHRVPFGSLFYFFLYLGSFRSAIYQYEPCCMPVCCC